ncbi:hypothetical protein [Rubritalea tangerina]|uniref:hypothetical protein n=1 Tax=Rubritalea tangerina TaxID=430798 RepID=UPI00360FFCFE
MPSRCRNPTLLDCYIEFFSRLECGKTLISRPFSAPRSKAPSDSEKSPYFPLACSELAP